MNPYPETPDAWIERQPEHAPPEGVIWCSDCGEWIDEPCEHFPEVEDRVSFAFDFATGKCIVTIK